MNESEKRLEQVKRDINGEIRLIFGIAFFVMLLGCDILLFLTENDRKVFWLKSLLLLLIFVFLYLVCIRIVGTRLKGLFEPVDKYMKNSDSMLVSLKKENEDNRDSIKAFTEKSEKIKNEATDTVDEFNKKSKTISDNKKAYILMCKRENELLDNINDTLNKIKEIKNDMAFDNEKLTRGCSEVNRASKEIDADFEEINKAYDNLFKVLQESMEVSESLMTDISLIQSDLATIDSNSSHVSLEHARLGQYSFTITNGLDEIKRLSRKIDERTDEISGYVLRTKTNLRLAEDQADYCYDNQKLGKNAIDEVLEKVSDIGASSESIGRSLEVLLEDIGTIEELSTELSKISTKEKSLSESTYSENEALHKLVNNMGESLKNK